eukprot:251204-Amphidinium_carterae.1
MCHLCIRQHVFTELLDARLAVALHDGNVQSKYICLFFFFPCSLASSSTVKISLARTHRHRARQVQEHDLRKGVSK